MPLSVQWAQQNKTILHISLWCATTEAWPVHTQVWRPSRVPSQYLVGFCLPSRQVFPPIICLMGTVAEIKTCARRHRLCCCLDTRPFTPRWAPEAFGTDAHIHSMTESLMDAEGLTLRSQSQVQCVTYRSTTVLRRSALHSPSFKMQVTCSGIKSYFCVKMLTTVKYMYSRVFSSYV